MMSPQKPYGGVEREQRLAVGREDAVEQDHRPDVAQHDAADEVRHEEHRAEQVGAACMPLREHAVPPLKASTLMSTMRYDGKQPP